MSGRFQNRWTLGAAALGAAVPIALAFAQSGSKLSKSASLPNQYLGVNIGAGSFGGQNRPGRYGYDYAYPTKDEAAPFAAAGMNAVRIPFLWERLQYSPDAPLERSELARLDASVNAMNRFQLIVLDLHNYAAFHGIQLDDARLPSDALANFWSQIARHYMNDRRVAFGIMNEPNQIDPQTWRGFAERALLAIRATGATNLVLVSGANWDGAHSWLRGGKASNGSVLSDLHDPAGNMAFEMHQYADADSSGTHWTCVVPEVAADRLNDATQWLRLHKQRGFLGEFGASGDPNCLSALDAMLHSVSDASDVWLGWTYWSAGNRWGSYPMSVQPDAQGPKPQMAVLKRFLPPEVR